MFFVEYSPDTIEDAGTFPESPNEDDCGGHYVLGSLRNDEGFADAFLEVEVIKCFRRTENEVKERSSGEAAEIGRRAIRQRVSSVAPHCRRFTNHTSVPRYLCNTTRVRPLVKRATLKALICLT